nr:hypothetical protein [Desulfonatronospira thiodismutans]
MPNLQQIFIVLCGQAGDFAEFLSVKAMVSGQLNVRRQPEFGLRTPLPYVNMSRLRRYALV